MATATQNSTVLIAGNTYPVKDALRAMGGRWNPAAKGWMIPAAKADEARRLVAAATKNTYTPSRRSQPRDKWSGCSCGSIDGQPRRSDCARCRFDNS
jgi:hypothetical protein